MDELVAVASVLGALLLVLVLLALGVLARRILLTSRQGFFDCSLRWNPQDQPWTFGFARYERDRLDWYRLLGLSLRPSRSLSRGLLMIVERQLPEAVATQLPAPGWVLVRCSYGDRETVELSMSEPAYNGLATWLESAPPGEHPLLT